jgi:DNA-binding GntR family transcriptional regulator
MKLPSITELMREFDVPGLNTVRDAQQVPVREGLLRTEQGVGAWVLAQHSPTTEMADVLERLRGALRAGPRDRLPRETQVGR